MYIAHEVLSPFFERWETSLKGVRKTLGCHISHPRLRLWRTDSAFGFWYLMAQDLSKMTYI